MGSTHSSMGSAQQPTSGVVRLKCPRNVVEHLVLLPLAPLMLDQPLPPEEDPTTMALYQRLYAARCEPTVCHWFDAAPADIDRSQEVTPPPPSLEQYLRTELCSEQQWALLSFGSTTPLLDADASSSPCCLDVSEVLSKVQLATVVGTVGITGGGEGGEDGQQLDFFLTKAFLNEAKSLALFQLLAWATDGSSTDLHPLTLRLRRGNLPCFRLMQKLFRLHLQHLTQPMEVVPTSATSELVLVKLNVFAIADLVAGLADAVTLEDAAEGGEKTSSLCLLAQQGNGEAVTPLPSPLDDYVVAAKALWSAENAVVPDVNPKATVRRPRRFRPSRTRSTSTDEPATDAATPSDVPDRLVTLPEQLELVSNSNRTSSEGESTSIGASSLGSSVPTSTDDEEDIHHYSIACTTTTAPAATRATSSAKTYYQHTPYTPYTAPRLAAADFELQIEPMTPIHLRGKDGRWVPLYWEFSEGPCTCYNAVHQPHLADGKALLECHGSVHLSDVEGRMIVVDSTSSSRGFTTHFHQHPPHVFVIEIAVPLTARVLAFNPTVACPTECVVGDLLDLEWFD